MKNDDKKIPHCCSHKSKKRTEDEKKLLTNRLKRIEGQVRGIINMIDNDAYCTDVLTQSAAVSKAMNSFNKELLSSHIKTCVADGIKKGDDEVIEELVVLMQKLMR